MFARVVAVSTALAVSGCSFVFVRDAPPPQAPLPSGIPPSPPSCTDHYVVPIIDAAITAIALAGVIYFATSDDDMKEVGMVVEGGIALGFGYSALRGRAKVKRCRAVR
jgi:hypothetical protein